MLTSQDAVIESGAGQIGTADTPFITEIADGYKVTARAANGIWITEASGDINVSQIYSPTTIALTSPAVSMMLRKTASWILKVTMSL